MCLFHLRNLLPTCFNAHKHCKPLFWVSISKYPFEKSAKGHFQEMLAVTPSALIYQKLSALKDSVSFDTRAPQLAWWSHSRTVLSACGKAADPRNCARHSYPGHACWWPGCLTPAGTQDVPPPLAGGTLCQLLCLEPQRYPLPSRKCKCVAGVTLLA